MNRLRLKLGRGYPGGARPIRMTVQQVLLECLQSQRSDVPCHLSFASAPFDAFDTFV